MRKRDIIGEVINGWTVLEESSKPRYVLCRCVCGTEKPVFKANLLNGVSKSCGCLHRCNTNAANTTHGIAKLDKRFYNIYKNMVSRCHDPKNKRYKDYGEMGVIVCERWHNITTFYEDMYSGYLLAMIEFEGKASIERKSNSLGYSTDNCVWISSLDQVFHRDAQTRNNTGVSGVVFDSDRNRYIVSMREYRTSKKYRKVFSVSKYENKEAAFLAAVMYRKQQIDIQNNNGAKYVQEELNGYSN